MALTVDIPEPVLVYAERDRFAGTVWLTNGTGADVTLQRATMHVQLPTPESADIPLPADTVMAPGATRQLTVQTAIPTFTAPGEFPGHIDLESTAGVQTITLTLVVVPVVEAAVGPEPLTLTGVQPGATVGARLVVVNRGNVPFTLGPVPPEDVFEVVVVPRVVEVDGATLRVAPAPSTASAGQATFSDPGVVVEPGSWAAVTLDISLPQGLTADRHYRVLPRLATARAVVDLLT
jgi:hypothetical protein